MLDRYNRQRRGTKEPGYRSGLEKLVEDALREGGHLPEYEAASFDYVLHRKYKPDFRVGNVYVEVKGWWAPADRSKFLSVIINNPTLRIFVALQRPHLTLSKKSKTTYAEWCEKHGIAWCPTPIPPDFMEQWQRGRRLTYRAQEKTVTVPTRPPSAKTAASTATPAASVTQMMVNLGEV